ncbi:MAG: hypothetical protein ACHQQS_08740 [Thermoanaerobaculales bacterium]
MTKGLRSTAFSLIGFLILPAFVAADTLQAGFHFGRQSTSQLAGAQVGTLSTTPPVLTDPPAAPFCPGNTIPFQASFVGTQFGTINVGDTVVGTAAFGGVIVQTCVVNTGPGTTGTCIVAPGGSSISFNLGNVQSGSDFTGTALIPLTAPVCGTLTVTVDLTEPHVFHYVENDPYSCDGACTAIPALGGPGLVALALLLAAIAVGVIRRR